MIFDHLLLRNGPIIKLCIFNASCIEIPVSTVAALTQGSFSFAYKLDNLSNGLNALFALSQKDAENGYGAIFNWRTSSAFNT